MTATADLSTRFILPEAGAAKRGATYMKLSDAAEQHCGEPSETEMRRIEADRKIAAAKLDARERQRLQVQRDIDVHGVIEAAQSFQLLMDEVIQHPENIGTSPRGVAA